MDYSATIARFVSAAQQYCSWLEAEPAGATQEQYAATRLIAELYTAALSLPDTQPTDSEAPSLSQEQRKTIAQRLKSFPFQYYWEIFDPVTDKRNDAVCGDVTDDLGDIYADVKEGLMAYASNEQCAVWHWRTTFGFGAATQLLPFAHCTVTSQRLLVSANYSIQRTQTRYAGSRR